MQDITEKLDDPEFCRAVVLSLRTYLSVSKWPDAPTDHLQKIAYGQDAGTKALMEIRAMD